MRRFFVVFLLGSAGGALAITIASSTRVGPASMIVFLATAVVSVVVLRFMRLGPNYKQAFLNCMGVGIIMTFAFFGWIIVMTKSAHLPWYAYVLILSFLTACVSLGSALAAAVVWNPPVETQPIFRLRCIQILTGCAVFAGADILIVLLRSGGANLFSDIELGRVLDLVLCGSVFDPLLARSPGRSSHHSIPPAGCDDRCNPVSYSIDGHSISPGARAVVRENFAPTASVGVHGHGAAVFAGWSRARLVAGETLSGTSVGGHNAVV